jgi:hypothetical protein
MKYIRGIIGLVILALGIAMVFVEQTKQMAWVIAGFGIGMTAGGFQNG